MRKHEWESMELSGGIRCRVCCETWDHLRTLNLEPVIATRRVASDCPGPPKDETTEALLGIVAKKLEAKSSAFIREMLKEAPTKAKTKLPEKIEFLSVAKIGAFHEASVLEIADRINALIDFLSARESE